MKQNEIPQDEGALGRIAKEVTYVVDDDGKYITGQSSGWAVKSEALDTAWSDVNEKIEAAKNKVQNGEASPLLYFMESKIMDVGILSSYTGFWKWNVKKHLTPDGFKKLSPEKLEKYAQLFEVSVAELLHPFGEK